MAAGRTGDRAIQPVQTSGEPHDAGGYHGVELHAALRHRLLPGPHPTRHDGNSHLFYPDHTLPAMM
eukprot:745668-Prorocentrum_minimum.AAC.1